VIYTVKEGDSLWKFANSYGISVKDIVDYNNLDTTLLSIGQQLLIPTITPSLDDNLTYIVKNGDSLWSVAKKYNISVDELKNYNNLMTNMLSIGQVLMIPGTDKYKTYIVKSGDSLYKIARENNVSINDLITLNNLSNTVLQIGQQLLIP
jgi:LysM repeat protein